jgi:hypothetical protein
LDGAIDPDEHTDALEQDHRGAPLDNAEEDVVSGNADRNQRISQHGPRDGQRPQVSRLPRR